MNKTALFLIVALLTTTHHNQTKTGLITNIAGVIIIAAAAIYGYNQLQESQKSDVDKTVKRLNAFADKIKEATTTKK